MCSCPNCASQTIPPCCVSCLYLIIPSYPFSSTARIWQRKLQSIPFRCLSSVKINLCENTDQEFRYFHTVCPWWEQPKSRMWVVPAGLSWGKGFSLLCCCYSALTKCNTFIPEIRCGGMDWREHYFAWSVKILTGYIGRWLHNVFFFFPGGEQTWRGGSNSKRSHLLLWPGDQSDVWGKDCWWCSLPRL